MKRGSTAVRVLLTIALLILLTASLALGQVSVQIPKKFENPKNVRIALVREVGEGSFFER